MFVAAGAAVVLVAAGSLLFGFSTRWFTHATLQDFDDEQGPAAIEALRVAAIPEIEELNIGHSIISRAVFIGLDRAVKEMREAMRGARSS